MYQIIDDFISKEEHSTISNILTSPNFPYYYQKSVSYYKNDNDSKFYFNHTLYDHTMFASWFYKQIMNPLLNSMSVKTLIRSKINCFIREEENYIHDFHVDSFEKHYVGLWYVNTNNGKTILKIDDDLLEIDSIANRMVIFDGSILHAPMSQTDTKIRVNVNINFL